MTNMFLLTPVAFVIIFLASFSFGWFLAIAFRKVEPSHPQIRYYDTVIDFDRYTYRVNWSIEDEAFVGLCIEFPALSCLHENRLIALEGIKRLVKDVATDMHLNGQRIPQSLEQNG